MASSGFYAPRLLRVIGFINHSDPKKALLWFQPPVDGLPLGGPAGKSRFPPCPPQTKSRLPIHVRDSKVMAVSVTRIRLLKSSVRIKSGLQSSYT